MTLKKLKETQMKNLVKYLLTNHIPDNTGDNYVFFEEKGDHKGIGYNFPDEKPYPSLHRVELTVKERFFRASLMEVYTEVQLTDIDVQVDKYELKLDKQTLKDFHQARKKFLDLLKTTQERNKAQEELKLRSVLREAISKATAIDIG